MSATTFIEHEYFGARADELVDAVRAATREQAKADAVALRRYDALYAVCVIRAGGERGDRFEHELRSVALEVAIAANLSDRTVLNRMNQARRLFRDFPKVGAALGRGDLTLRHAEVILDEGAELTDPGNREAYAAQAIELAGDTTPGRLAQKVRRVVAALEAEAARERLRAKRESRSVFGHDLPNGMSELVAVLPSPVAHAIHDRLTQLAKTNREVDAFGRPLAETLACGVCDNGFVPVWKRTSIDGDPEWEVCPQCHGQSHDPDRAGGSANGDGLAFDVGAVANADNGAGTDSGTASSMDVHGNADGPTGTDPRSFDAIRADTLSDLLLAGILPDDSPHAAVNGIQGRVSVTVPVLSMAGITEEPATLDGVGPVPVDVAMRIAAGATIWQRVLTDPLTGEPLTADTYRPSAELRRFIETRDQHCRAPGCRRAAHRCDLDHTHDYAHGGTTSADNLAALCRFHHVTKHHGWQVEQGERGELTWQSPRGRRFSDRPDRLAEPMTTAQVLALIDAETPPPRVRFRPLPRPAPDADDDRDADAVDDPQRSGDTGDRGGTGDGGSTGDRGSRGDGGERRDAA